jgi:hypothetical protein
MKIIPCIAAALIIGVLPILSVHQSLAQLSLQQLDNHNKIDKIAYVVPQSSSSARNDERLTDKGVSTPMLQKLSDKGLFLVQLRWPQTFLFPTHTFSFQLFFLNASSTTAKLPQTEGNFSGSGAESSFTVPNTVAALLPIKSYDVTIYSNSGKILWQKLNQPGRGGAPGQEVSLNGDYAGPVTISVTNITPGWPIPANSHTSASGSNNNMTDSVKFTAMIVH